MACMQARLSFVSGTVWYRKQVQAMAVKTTVEVAKMAKKWQTKVVAKGIYNWLRMAPSLFMLLYFVPTHKLQN